MRGEATSKKRMMDIVMHIQAIPMMRSITGRNVQVQLVQKFWQEVRLLTPSPVIIFVMFVDMTELLIMLSWMERIVLG